MWHTPRLPPATPGSMLLPFVCSPDARKVLVIDVRDSDFAGGHIRGARNIGDAASDCQLQPCPDAGGDADYPCPSPNAAVSNFSDDYRVDNVIEMCRGMDTVVLHCYLSQQRGPFAAQRWITSSVKMHASGGGGGGRSTILCMHQSPFANDAG